MEEMYDVVGDIPGDHLSFSKIKTVQFCPEKFRLQYVEKARGLVRIPMLIGSGFHSGQEHTIKEMIRSRTPKAKEAVEVAVERLATDFKETKGIDFTPFDASKSVAKDDLKKMMEYGYSQILNFKPAGPGSSEKQFEFMLDPETKVKGAIDLVEKDQDGLGITETKTTTREPQDLILFDWQTSIYQSSQEAVKWLKKFFVVRHQNRNRDITILQFKKKADSKSWIEQILSDMKKIKEQIKSFSIHGYPKTSDLRTCSWCTYRYGCRPEIFKFEGATDRLISKEILFSTNPTRKGEIKNGESVRSEPTEQGSRGTTHDKLAEHQKGQRNPRGRKANPHNRGTGGTLPAGF